MLHAHSIVHYRCVDADYQSACLVTSSRLTVLMEDSESGTFSQFEMRQLEGNNQLYGSPDQIYCLCQ